MGWLLTIARIAGTTSPFTAWLVQAEAEIKAKDFQTRLERLEDPFSRLHPDVRELGRILYESIQNTDESRVQLDDTRMQRYARALAILKAAGCIEGTSTVGGGPFYGGIYVTDPSFLLYLCTLYEDSDLMDRFVERVEKTPARTSLRGDELSTEYALPLPIVKAVFQVYERRGLGILSKETGTVNYRTLA